MSDSPFRLPKLTQSGFPERLLEKIIGLRELEKKYNSAGGGHYQGKEFLKLILNKIGVDYNVASGEHQNTPATGSVVIVANHPFGGIEGVALADFLLSIRSDVKVLTNEILCKIPDLRDVFMGVDLFGKDRKVKNKRIIDEAQAWVKAGHALLIFPAGEVSSYHHDVRKIVDPPWRQTAARIILNTQAYVVPVFVEGSNGWLFQCLGLIHPYLRTLSLVRELINKKGCTLRFRIGAGIEFSDNKRLSSKALTNYLRLMTYLLAEKSRDQEQQQSRGLFWREKVSACEPIAVAQPVENIKNDIRALPESALLLQKGEMDVYCTTAGWIPHVLQEIGRLRETSFRGVGEGTGMPVDIDSYDAYYLHLFLWNREREEVIGAYRLGQVDKIVKEKGVHGIYSRSLFRYEGAFLNHLGCCLEMGRSFVRTEYQKSLLPLMLLWKGIGAFVSANPQYKVLFGPVSISSDYSMVSRHLMAGSLEVNNSDETLMALVEPTTPLKGGKTCFWRRSDLEGLGDIEKLSGLIQQIEKDNKGIPVLLRQYLKLSGELAAFNVDPDFNDALDGLIIVDLSRVDNRILSKYMGGQRAADFMDYHRSVA